MGMLRGGALIVPGRPGRWEGMACFCGCGVGLGSQWFSEYYLRMYRLRVFWVIEEALKVFYVFVGW